MHTTRLLTISLALIVAVPVSAQVTIVKGAASSGLARSMNNNSNALALTPDGAMWAVVYLADSAGKPTGTPIRTGSPMTPRPRLTINVVGPRPRRSPTCGGP